MERWGVRFLVDGDVLPAEPADLRTPTAEIHLEPNMRVRCWRLVNDLALGPVSWSLDENRRFLRQIAKMKYNRIFLSFWPCQPFVDYSFKGMRKPAPVLYFGERYPFDTETIGLEKFHGMAEFANPELADAASPDDLIEKAKTLARGILAEAASLGFETGIAIQPFEWPKEFMEVLPGSQPAHQLGQLTAGPGNDQSMDDPLLREMVATIVEAYLQTYPEAEYIHIGMPEHRGWAERARQAYETLDRRYGLGQFGAYEDLCSRARSRTTFPGGGERVEKMLKGDLASVAFFDSLSREKGWFTPNESGYRRKLVYSNVVEELFPLLSEVTPPGGEVLSFIDYTASRQLRQRELLRRSPPEGLPASLIFTLADDNVGVLPQLATGSLHEIMKELRASGWSGFYTRYWTVGDMDPTVHYLARASWDAAVTPQSAYRDLVTQVCGPDSVEPALKAFRTIEEITLGLDEHGLGFGFPVPEMMTKNYSSGGLSAELKADHARYREALDLMRDARSKSKPSGHTFLDYLVARLVFAVKYLDACEAFGATFFAEKSGSLPEAATSIDSAYGDIREAIGAWADVAKDHGDLGAVALMNEYCYKPICEKRRQLTGGFDTVERVPIGIPGDYKPCVAKLPSGELVLVAFQHHPVEDGKYREDILLFRSKDGGHSWSEGRNLEDLPGREPYLTVLRDGTLLMTVHYLAADVDNKNGYTHSYVHRSDDGGNTWTVFRAEPKGLPPKIPNCSTRNVLQLADGSLLLGVSGDRVGTDFIMRSYDSGRTWEEEYSASVEGVPENYPFPFFGEAHLWQAASGKIYAIARVDSKYFPPLPDRDAKIGDSDHFDRMILYSSTDLGRTWKVLRDFGDYGEMYPATLRLQDRRLLLTFTVRDVKRPLGVRAVLGKEAPDGFEFDFTSPRFLLDAKTPDDKDSGGGFGPTVQLEDGTLVTSYSYRGADDEVHCETIRWRLPKPVEPIRRAKTAKLIPVEGGESKIEPERCRSVIVGPGVNEVPPFPGYGGFVGWESPVRLRDGTWLVAFSAGYWHASPPTPLRFPPDVLGEWRSLGMPDVEAPTGGRAMVARSTDNGKTWSTPETLIDTPADDRHPSLLELPDGTLICSFFTYLGMGDYEKDPSIAHHTHITRSFDGGHTWESEAKPLPSPFVADETDGPMVLLEDGSVLLVLNGTPAMGVPDRVAVFKSRDRCQTWELLSILSTDRDLFEPSIAQLPDGRLVMMARPEGDIAWSEDGGRTWSQPVTFGLRLFAPSLYVLEDGTLVCLHGSYAAGGLRVTFSRDGGETWIGPSTDRGFPVDTSYGYGKAMELPDGSLFVTYLSTGGHRTEDARTNEVRCIRVRIRPDRSGIDLLPAPNRSDLE